MLSRLLHGRGAHGQAPLRALKRSRAYRHSCLTLLLTALTCTAASGATAPKVEVIRGTVVKVRDGDTLQFQTDAGARIEIRLNAIDAPERQSEVNRAQPFATSSRMHLARLVAQRRGVFQHVTMDRFGRHVGTLTVDTPHGRVDAALWQVEGGMAWVYTRYLSDLPPKLREKYVAAEKMARAEQRGLWRDARPVPPWEWRQKNPRTPNTESRREHGVAP